MKNEHLKSHFVFHLPKKRAEADPKKSALAQIFNRLRLQPKNLGFGRLRLCNTGGESCFVCSSVGQRKRE